VARPGVVNYQVGSALHENVFATNFGNLYLKYYDGTAWHSSLNLGNPGALLFGSPAAINYVAPYENVFVEDGNHNLDYAWTANGTTWTWVKLGNPGTKLVSNPAVANYQVGSALHENVFAIDQNGNLDLESWNGSKWQSWANLGNPGASLFTGHDPAVVNYGTYENVFVTDVQGNLDYAWSPDGKTWNWSKLGNPGVKVFGDPAAINYQGPYENVFVEQENASADLAYDYWNGTKWTWVKLGNPGVPLLGAPTAINYPVGGVLHENVFVNDQNHNLDLAYWDGASWHWSGMGNNGVPLFGDPAAINYAVGGVLHENVFVIDHNYNLDIRYWDGAAWHWGGFGTVGSSPVSSISSSGQGSAAPQSQTAVAGAETGAVLSLSKIQNTDDLFFAAQASQEELLQSLGLPGATELDLLAADLLSRI
jgi:hypothetical protein